LVGAFIILVHCPVTVVQGFHKALERVEKCVS
jgi:hypothetical protein